MPGAGSHDNIVALRGLCQHEGRYALVMEYCPRGTLDVLLHHTASKRMEASRLLPLIRSIARGMLHLHTRRPPILHRDLKPANIFVGALPARLRMLGVHGPRLGFTWSHACVAAGCCRVGLSCSCRAGQMPTSWHVLIIIIGMLACRDRAFSFEQWSRGMMWLMRLPWVLLRLRALPPRACACAAGGSRYA